MNTTIEQIYKKRHNHFSEQLLLLKQKSRFTAYWRGVIFLAGVAAAVFVFRYGYGYTIATGIAALIPFLFFVKRSVQLRHRISFTEQMVKNNENELKALAGNFSVFEAGEPFVNYEHAYSYDLDIFGKNSLFQCLNRTSTIMGTNRLAQQLQSPERQKTSIESMQQAVAELRPETEWRQTFQATGNLLKNRQNKAVDWFSSSKKKANRIPETEKEEIARWLQQEPLFLNNRFLQWLRIVSPVVAVLLLLGTIAGWVPVMTFILYGLFQLGIVGFHTKKINQLHNLVNRKQPILNNYAKLLKLIEDKEFKSDYLHQWQSSLRTDERTACTNLKDLGKIINFLDNRLNLLFTVLFNGLLLWDLQFIFRLEKWQQRFKDQLLNWFDVIGKFDAVSSWANFAHNHPQFTFPEIADDEFVFDMQEGGHPLIDSDKRIDNSFSLHGTGRIAIITGANMAGKSTFLRTIGVNMLLGLCGSVVCAQKLVFSPISIFTSVRTNDSLHKNESYFFAELKRLKAIIETLENGQPQFVIIDEMLRGTNSKDKHHGSEALIKKLIRLKSNGLVATHDIALGKLQSEYPDNIKNCRFEVEIKENQLHFDYKLKEGISQNLNATFLMRQMRIIE